MYLAVDRGSLDQLRVSYFLMITWFMAFVTDHCSAAFFYGFFYLRRICSFLAMSTPLFPVLSFQNIRKLKREHHWNGVKFDLILTGLILPSLAYLLRPYTLLQAGLAKRLRRHLYWTATAVH